MSSQDVSNIPPENENDFEDYSDEEEEKKSPSEFEALLNESFKKPQKKLSVGDKIRGEILMIGKEDVFVSTGTQNDGTVSRRDIIDKDGNLTHKVGDVLELFVTQVRGTEISLSINKTSKNLADDIEDAFDKMIPVEGRVVEVVKGGVRVSVHGKLAFCPISQLDFSRVETGEEFVDKKFEFMITKFSGGGKDIVVSRKKVLQEQRGMNEVTFSEERKEGTIVAGKVKRVDTFGAFVEVAPGIEGLLHVSEMAWSRVEDPNEIVKVGQELVVKILKTENKDGKLRISLSLKQVGPTPWENLPPEIKEGAVVSGKVTRCMKFGAFVEIAPGLEGLVPLSEMSYTQRVMRSDEIIKEGEKVVVKIKEIHPETKRIALSLKDAGEDPWAMVEINYPVGKLMSGKIERREPYGLFVQLEDGITALLAKSKTMEHPGFNFEKVRIGDMIMVQIGEVRTGERRISLDMPVDPSKEDWKGYVAPSAGSFGTLGDQLKNVMTKKKAK